MSWKRRDFFQAVMGGGLLLAGAKSWASQHSQHMQHRPTITGEKSAEETTVPAGPFLAVETPDLPKLPWHVENGVKVFHLLPEVVKREFLPGSTFDTWGFNGTTPGPAIEVMEGDRVRIVVENRLPEPTSIHWHGLEVPIGMDGVSGLTQDPIPPGGTFVYEYMVHQHCTFFYHSHMPMQQMMGLIGLFIIHPRKPYQPSVDKDFGLIVQGWAILPNNTVPNSMAMEFNWLTINGKAGPATTPLIVRRGDRVRIRFVNLGMDHHPMHLHGNTFYVTGTEAGRVPEAAWTPANTVLVGVAQARDVEFEANYPGDWMLHCHLPHHMANHMASMVGPLAHVSQGMHAGLGMEQGMGMLERGHALSEEIGPSFGRGMGVGATLEEAITNMGIGPSGQPRPEASGRGQQVHGEQPQTRVPGFPQDMHMAMDELVAKPETYAMRPTWSAAISGMMTVVRVLPPDLYAKVRELQAQGRKEAPSPMPHKHQHGS